MADPLGLSKRDLRRSLLRFANMFWPVITTDDGAGDGSTAVAAGYDGTQTASFQYWWLLWDTVADMDPDSGLYNYRNVSQIDPATGTFTLFQAYPTQVLEGATLELMPLRPDLMSEVLNQAMTEAYPSLHANNVNDDLTVDQDSEGQQEYDLPEGITPDLITKIMVEGDGVFAGIPFYQIPTPTYSADGTKLYLNRLVSQITDFQSGKVIYIYYQTYLTPLDDDETYGVITHDVLADDETGVLLQPRTQPWELLMLFGRAILYELLAAAPGTVNPTDVLAKAQRFRALAEAKKSSFRQEILESAGMFQ